MRLTGAQALIKSLETQGVEVMFGLPGGAILPVYDPIIDSSIRHILVRHEQGAGPHGRGVRQGDRPARRGDGDERAGGDQHRHAARQRLHGLHPARRRSRARSRRPRSAPTPSRSATSPASPWASPSTTGWSPSADDIPRIVAEAFHVATTGRPGPVLIDVPKDVSNAQMDWYWPSRSTSSTCPATRRCARATPRPIRRGRRAHAGGRAARHLRRRRGAEGPRLRRRCASWPSAPGSRSSPRSWDAAASPTRTRSVSACPACTATTRPSPRCSGAIC